MIFTIHFAVCVPSSWRTYDEVVADDEDFCWLPISKAALYNDLLIDEWLARERLTCCDFQGGFLIDVDKKRWNDTLVDEYWMTMSWLKALTDLMQGEQSVMAYPWEESHLILERSGDQLTLYERDHQRHGLCAPITLPFTAVTQHVAGQSRLFATWVRSLHASIAQRNLDLALLSPRIAMALSPEEKLVKIQQEISAECLRKAEQFARLFYGH